MEYSIASRATNTDEWVRLFISSVRDLDKVAVCICGMSLSCAPIIHANTGFLSMTGYALNEVVGRSCRFLQGPKTDPSSVSVMRDAIRTGTSCQVRLLNYRKDGSVFNNLLCLRPLFDCEGHLVFMCSIGVEVHDSFAVLKPLLTQMERLDKLLPSTINLPAPPSVRKRMVVVHDAMLAARAKHIRRRGANSNTAEALDMNTGTSASEVSIARTKERLRERQRAEEEQKAMVEQQAASEREERQRRAEAALARDREREKQKRREKHKRRKKRQQQSEGVEHAAREAAASPAQTENGSELSARSPPLDSKEAVQNSSGQLAGGSERPSPSSSPPKRPVTALPVVQTAESTPAPTVEGQSPGALVPSPPSYRASVATPSSGSC